MCNLIKFLKQLNQSLVPVPVVIQISTDNPGHSNGYFLKTDTRNDTLFDSETVLNNTLPIPISCKFRDNYCLRAPLAFYKFHNY